MVFRKQNGKRTTIVLVAMLCFLALAICPLRTYADTYAVTAAVPYPAPTQAAVITQPADNTTVSDALQTIAGSCELLSPEGVVSIWRNGSSIGSTICNGSFSIPVMLQPGINILIARSASASAQYGPDSAPLTITLNLPPTAITGGTNASNGGAPTTVTTNAAAASNFTVIPSTTFSALDSSNSVSITLSIEGGTPPYNISLNWGDGSVETRTVDEPGVHSFTHTYTNTAVYIVHGQAQDAKGAIAVFSYAVVSTQKPRSPGGRIFPKISRHTVDIAVWVIVLAIIVLLLLDYWLGWETAKKHYQRLLSKQRQRRKMRKKKARRS